MGFMGKHHRIQPENPLAASGNSVLWDSARVCGIAFKPWLVLAVGVSACASSPNGIQGRWIGTVKPVSGNCDPASQAVLDIVGATTPPYTAIFTPTGGVLTLHGSSDGVSQVSADLHTTGMNHQPYTLAFSGTRNGNYITGSYVTPRCRSTVELARR